MMWTIRGVVRRPGDWAWSGLHEWGEQTNWISKGNWWTRWMNNRKPLTAYHYFYATTLRGQLTRFYRYPGPHPLLGTSLVQIVIQYYFHFRPPQTDRRPRSSVLLRCWSTFPATHQGDHTNQGKRPECFCLASSKSAFGKLWENKCSRQCLK